MLHSLSCLTVGGADEGEAGEDPQEDHGSNMKAPSERRTFIQTRSDRIGQEGRVCVCVCVCFYGATTVLCN